MHFITKCMYTNCMAGKVDSLQLLPINHFGWVGDHCYIFTLHGPGYLKYICMGYMATISLQCNSLSEMHASVYFRLKIV